MYRAKTETLLKNKGQILIIQLLYENKTQNTSEHFKNSTRQRMRQFYLSTFHR